MLQLELVALGASLKLDPRLPVVQARVIGSILDELALDLVAIAYTPRHETILPRHWSNLYLLWLVILCGHAAVLQEEVVRFVGEAVKVRLNGGADDFV